MEEVLHPQSSLKSDSIYSIFVTYGRMVPELMVTRELLMCSHQSEIQTSTGLLLAPARVYLSVCSRALVALSLTLSLLCLQTL